MPYATKNSRHAARKTDMSLMGICHSKKAKYNEVYPQYVQLMFIFDVMFRFVKLHIHTNFCTMWHGS